LNQRPDRVSATGPAVPSAGHGPPVLVLAEAAQSDLAAEACARLARHGFVAWAPPLPSDGSAPSADERSAVAAGVERLLREHASDGPRVGVVGFGRGGELGLDAASRNARVATVIALDGDLGTSVLDGLAPSNTKAPVLAIFAEKGAAALRGGASALARRLREAGVPCDVRVLPGVEPGFLDPAAADRYDAVAARAAWDAALARLRADL
jgi:dienelactone hydrolase